jgi:hypothetical protein
VYSPCLCGKLLHSCLGTVLPIIPDMGGVLPGGGCCSAACCWVTVEVLCSTFFLLCSVCFDATFCFFLPFGVSGELDVLLLGLDLLNLIYSIKLQISCYFIDGCY